MTEVIVEQPRLHRVCYTCVLLAAQYNNEYFIKMTYIPHEDLHQNVLKEKNLVYTSGTPRRRHTKIVITIGLVLVELQSPDCFIDL